MVAMPVGNIPRNSTPLVTLPRSKVSSKDVITPGPEKFCAVTTVELSTVEPEFSDTSNLTNPSEPEEVSFELSLKVHRYCPGGRVTYGPYQME